MVTSHDGGLTSSICNDECSHDDTTLFPIDECICSSTNSIEYVPCTTSTSCCQYELCTLCKLDDEGHYNRCVFSHGGVSMYDQSARSLMKRFDETSYFRLGCYDERVLDVRAVRSCCDIILDSGSDATVIKIGMFAAGAPAADQSSYLRDAQGSRIETEGVRDISIVLSAVDGSEVVLRDKAHVSGRVDTPLISYGKLLRHGWGIVPEPGGKSFRSKGRSQFQAKFIAGIRNCQNDFRVCQGHRRGCS